MGKLGIYLVANYPSKEAFISAVKICEGHKVDFLEVGLPFSDPVADGEVIERAAHETLGRYTTLECMESVREAGSVFGGRTYIMTYANVVYGMGIDRFAEGAGAVTGLILADVPLREVGFFEKKLAGKRIRVIRFLTPESRDEDIEYALKGSKDFIYFVSKRGTTGGDFSLGGETRAKIALARGRGSEVYIGFGIKERKDVEMAFAAADGAIIGTRAVEALNHGPDAFEAYIRGLTGRG